MRFPALFLVLFVCVSSGFAQEEFEGFPYDPEGSTITTDKEIQPQTKRMISFNKEGIWIDNDFPGARLQDVHKISSNRYRIEVEPEISPINNSPWYAFRIQSDSSRTITLELSYKEGRHRYHPKVSSDGHQWKQVSSDAYTSSRGTAEITLEVGPEPKWVSAQELISMDTFLKWAHSLSSHPDVFLDFVGFSHDQRPINKLTISSITSSPKRGVLILTGRQHPPEITGALAMQKFMETLVSDHPTAIAFRRHFEVWAYPMINPDGVQRGHWRQNAAGVDLNRDWKQFNQPETQSVRNDLLTLKNDSLRKVFYGIDFHSTNQNIFYPINREIATFPDDFTYQWIDSLQKEIPEFSYAVESFDTRSPITKNWIYHTFGADAVTYEMADDLDREMIDTVAQKSALIIMRKLLEKKITQEILLTER